MTALIDQIHTEHAALYHGDAVEIARALPDDSVDYILFSPPFESLYVYSDSDRDMGNCRSADEFAAHYRFLVAELIRVLAPGRLMSCHCMLLTSMKAMHGHIGLRDFRGDLIRLNQEAGFYYHAEVTIWKDPVVEMQRTKALGLLYKQLNKDSTMSRQGLADYLCTFRKPGDNPRPVTHESARIPLETWQRYASPVWFDIRQTRVLSGTMAREEADERHICALQLDVIERALTLWTNPGDVVLDPFGGIGSTPVVAVEMARRAIAAELKPSYFRQMVRNVQAAETARTQGALPLVEAP